MPGERAIVITGASSGIGAALAERYAEPGVVLGLLGRDRARLAAVAERCRAAGAVAEPLEADVTEAARLGALLRAFDARWPVGLLIANAGISGGTSGLGESDAQARQIFAVNVDGVINTVGALLGPMRARRGGQIALMSSLAGFRGFPGAPAYCASKAAVRVYGEALRGLVAAEGVGVSVICPGYVDSPMTQANGFRMPLLMDAPRAAAIIRRGLDRNRPRIAFPWRAYALVRLVTALPQSWTDLALARLPRKAPLR